MTRNLSQVPCAQAAVLAAIIVRLLPIPMVTESGNRTETGVPRIIGLHDIERGYSEIQSQVYLLGLVAYSADRALLPLINPKEPRVYA